MSIESSSGGSGIEKEGLRKTEKDSTVRPIVREGKGNSDLNRDDVQAHIKLREDRKNKFEGTARPTEEDFKRPDAS